MWKCSLIYLHFILIYWVDLVCMLKLDCSNMDINLTLIIEFKDEIWRILRAFKIESWLIRHLLLILIEVRGLLMWLENVSNFSSFSAHFLSKSLWLDSHKLTDTDGCSCNTSCWQCGCLTLDGFISKHYGLHQWLITIILITKNHLCSSLTSCKLFSVQLAPECPLHYHVITCRWARHTA